jgi:hypothetical protein
VKLLLVRSSVCLFVFVGSKALADWQWTAAGTANFYAKPDENSEIVKSIGKDEMVLITKLRKSQGDWVSLTLVNENKKVFLLKKTLGEGLIRNAKREESQPTQYLKNFGIGLALTADLRAPISKDAAGGEIVEFGPQLGMTFYPIIHTEFPGKSGKAWRLFLSLRQSKSTGEVVIKQNGNLVSQELVTQTISFMSVGVLYRDLPAATSNWWYGYGAEIAKATSGKQEYTDGAYVDLKDSLPTNFYLQGSLGYQKYPPRSSQWMPEFKASIAFNKPVVINAEFLANWVKAF